MGRAAMPLNKKLEVSSGTLVSSALPRGYLGSAALPPGAFLPDGGACGFPPPGGGGGGGGGGLLSARAARLSGALGPGYHLGHLPFGIGVSSAAAAAAAGYLIDGLNLCYPTGAGMGGGAGVLMGGLAMPCPLGGVLAVGAHAHTRVRARGGGEETRPRDSSVGRAPSSSPLRSLSSSSSSSSSSSLLLSATSPPVPHKSSHHPRGRDVLSRSFPGGSLSRALREARQGSPGRRPGATVPDEPPWLSSDDELGDAYLVARGLSRSFPGGELAGALRMVRSGEGPGEDCVGPLALPPPPPPPSHLSEARPRAPELRAQRDRTASSSDATATTTGLSWSFPESSLSKALREARQADAEEPFGGGGGGSGVGSSALSWSYPGEGLSRALREVCRERRGGGSGGSGGSGAPSPVAGARSTAPLRPGSPEHGPQRRRGAGAAATRGPGRARGSRGGSAAGPTSGGAARSARGAGGGLSRSYPGSTLSKALQHARGPGGGQGLCASTGSLPSATSGVRGGRGGRHGGGAVAASTAALSGGATGLEGEDEELTNLDWLHESKNLLRSLSLAGGAGSGGAGGLAGGCGGGLLLRSLSPLRDAGAGGSGTTPPPLLPPFPGSPEHAHGGGGGPGGGGKPPYSFSCLIFLAIECSAGKRLPVRDIYNWILENFPYFASAPTGWKNSVRHNLSLNKCFRRVEKDRSQGIGKGSLWCIDPEYRPSLLQALRKTPYQSYSHVFHTPPDSPPPPASISPKKRCASVDVGHNGSLTQESDIAAAAAMMLLTASRDNAEEACSKGAKGSPSDSARSSQDQRGISVKSSLGKTVPKIRDCPLLPSGERAHRETSPARGGQPPTHGTSKPEREDSGGDHEDGCRNGGSPRDVRDAHKLSGRSNDGGTGGVVGSSHDERPWNGVNGAVKSEQSSLCRDSVIARRSDGTNVDCGAAGGGAAGGEDAPLDLRTARALCDGGTTEAATPPPRCLKRRLAPDTLPIKKRRPAVLEEDATAVEAVTAAAARDAPLASCAPEWNGPRSVITHCERTRPKT